MVDQVWYIYLSLWPGLQGAGSDDGAGGGGSPHLRFFGLLCGAGLGVQGWKVDIPGQCLVGHPHCHHRWSSCQVSLVIIIIAMISALSRSPQTFTGKLLGGFCALAGTFILTLPIPIVVNSFANYYKNRLWRNEVAVKKDIRRKELKVKNNLHMW